MKDLFNIVKQKVERDQQGTWSKGSITYFNAMFDELKEVKEEIKPGRQCYLEDELGDVLWVYLCMIRHMEIEGKVSVDGIIHAAINKYKERMDGLNEGKSWEQIKMKQKKEILKQQNKLNETNN